MGPEMVILPAFFLMVAFTVWTSITVWLRRQQLRLLTEFNHRLIDRLGSVTDFSEFAKTDFGAQVLNALLADSFAPRPRERILRAAEMGVVLAALGAGLLFLGQHFGFEGHDAFTAVGVIALSLGIGFLVSAVVSYRIASALAVPSSRAGQGRGLED